MSQRTRFFGNVRSGPQWAADFGRGPQIGVPFPAKLDPSAFPSSAAVQVIVGAAGAAANATSVPTDAVTLALSSNTVAIQGANQLIPSGTALYFGASKKLALLTADVKIGDTAISVQALPTALVDNDVAYYSRSGSRTIPGGTVLGRTYAERDANTPFGAAAVSDDEIYLMLFDIPDANLPGADDCEVYRHSLTVKENYLPEYATLNVAADEVQTLVFGGTASGGTFKLTVPKPDGSQATTDAIAWNATNGTIITNAQAALDDALGANKIIVTDNGGAAANPNMKFTFSGTGYTGLPFPQIIPDASALTGATTAVVATSTQGGKSLLDRLRQLYTCIKGVD